MKKLLQDAIRERPLLGDGAMGTQLMLAGLEQGNCGEAWNLTHPERVLAIQRRYAEAGSECILTNTFGGSRIMLNRHGQADHVAEINKAGVAIAREAFGEQRRLRDRRHRPVRRPAGALSAISPKPRCAAPSRSRPRRWWKAGADAIIIETQTSLEELLIGIEAARKAGAPCIIGSMAYDVTLDGSTFRTMMGIDPERAAEFMEEHGAHIVALNCGTGMDMERARDGGGALQERDQPAGDGAAQCRTAQAGEYESGLRRNAGADGARALCRCSRRARILSAPAAAARRNTSAPSGKSWTSFWNRSESNCNGAQRESQTLRCEPGRRGETSAAHRRQIGHRRALRRCVHQADEREARRRNAGEMQAPRTEDHPLGGRQKRRRPDAPARREPRPGGHARRGACRKPPRRRASNSRSKTEPFSLQFDYGLAGFPGGLPHPGDQASPPLVTP